jgi:uncharacterized membrane protein YfcA
MLGTVHSGRASHAVLKRVIALVLIIVAIQMGLRAFGVNIGR